MTSGATANVMDFGTRRWSAVEVSGTFIAFHMVTCMGVIPGGLGKADLSTEFSTLLSDSSFDFSRSSVVFAVLSCLP